MKTINIYCFTRGRGERPIFLVIPMLKNNGFNVPYKILWDQIFMPFLALRARLDLLFSPKWGVALISPCKTVMVLHGTQNYIHPEFYKARDILYFNLMMPLYLGKAAKTIVVSNRSKDDIVKFTGVNKSKVVVHLAAEDIFGQPIDPAFIESISFKYGLPSKFILHVGVVYLGKNIERVVQAFAKLTEKFPHKLVLIGGLRWKYDRVFNFIDELNLKDKVIMIKWVSHSELRVFYNRADLLIFPSFYESFPAPPLEAITCGCPVVTSYSGGTPEVVGDAALMVDPTSVDEIYRATAEALEVGAIRAKLIREGFFRFKKFSWEKSARETLAVFKEVKE